METKRKNTIQRIKILDYLKSVDTHPSAEMVYESIHDEMPTITLATVYRNLHTLADEGIIQRFKVGNSYRFDGRNDKHYHFICIKCGTIYDIESENYNSFIDHEYKFLEKKGFHVENHNLTFYGTCDKCEQKDKQDK